MAVKLEVPQLKRLSKEVLGKVQNLKLSGSKTESRRAGRNARRAGRSLVGLLLGHFSGNFSEMSSFLTNLNRRKSFSGKVHAQSVLNPPTPGSDGRNPGSNYLVRKVLSA